MRNLSIWRTGLLVAFLLSSVAPAGAQPASSLSRIRHVFVIVLENESYDATFGPAPSGQPEKFPAEYLRGIARQGALLRQYYGIGHHSLDNYIAMISGQGPNYLTQSDCQDYVDFVKTGTGAWGQALGAGCVYPAGVPTLVTQHRPHQHPIRWKAYMEDMGNEPMREASTCGHPKLGDPDGTQNATPTDQYATRHDPFVYFHAIIDSPACGQHVVNLSKLQGDLANAAATPDFVFITPNLCNDGHDGGPNRLCRNGDPGGLVSADRFLARWVPKILASPAYKRDGLLVITFDEADTDDASGCCGEGVGPNIHPDRSVFGDKDYGPGIAGNGGGRIGAVLLSPFIAPHCVATPYNHYSLLRTVEDIFGVEHLGYAAQRDVRAFGSDVWRGAHRGGCATL